MMNEKFKNYYGFLRIALLVFLVIAVSSYITSYAKSIAPGRTLAVSGEGKVTVVPDVAELTFGLLTEGGKDIASLAKSNNDKINLIITSLKENGIAENDIVTRMYNIAPRYQYFSCNPSSSGAAPCPPAEIVGYSVTQNVSVKIRDIKKAGDIVGVVVNRGANTVSSLSFTVDDPSAIQNRARENALAKAKESAGSMAAAGGFGLRKIVSVKEAVSSPQAVSFPTGAGLGGAGGGASVQPGTQDITATVILVYEIR